MEYVAAGFVMSFGLIGFLALGFLCGVLYQQKAHEMTEVMEDDEFVQNQLILMNHFPANN